VSGGELTPSNKLRRSYIIKKYENEIKAMYLDLD
jgi:long-subunit acyl-CoA synthetase (AMP-forming)